MTVLVHNPVVVRRGRGWGVECTCGRDDLNAAPTTTKHVASMSANAHTRVQVNVGGAVTVTAADAALVPDYLVTEAGYAVRAVTCGQG